MLLESVAFLHHPFESFPKDLYGFLDTRVERPQLLVFGPKFERCLIPGEPDAENRNRKLGEKNQYG